MPCITVNLKFDHLHTLFWVEIVGVFSISAGLSQIVYSKITNLKMIFEFLAHALEIFCVH